MRVYLVQHGQAKTEDEDPERPLTAQGLDDVTRVAHQALEQLGLRPTRVLHSGKTRARQTADMWGGLLGADVVEADDLAPNDDPSTWAERLDADAGVDGVLLVGHMPHLGRLAGLLVTGSADNRVVAFRPGGVVGLVRTDTGWLVSAVLPPGNA